MNDLKYFLKYLARGGGGVRQSANSVALFDTAVATLNLGDEIIMDAVAGEIRRLFPEAFVYRLPTHERIGLRSYRIVNQSVNRFVGGSNILSTQVPFDFQWKLRPLDLLYVTNLILVGVGWRSYSLKPGRLGGAVHRRLLNGRWLHSVRDQLTVEMMNRMGIDNVINTGCVTMWGLTREVVAAIPKSPARAAVVTLNAFDRDPSDAAFAEIVSRRYDTVYMWPQSIEDMAYATYLFGNRAVMLAPTLAAFDALLEGDEGVDYVGYRLHGGIRALQRRRRTLVVSVDNRAVEIARDTGLPTIARPEIARDLADRLGAAWPTPITIPLAAIDAWRSQFRQPEHLPQVRELCPIEP